MTSAACAVPASQAEAVPPWHRHTTWRRRTTSPGWGYTGGGLCRFLDQTRAHSALPFVARALRCRRRSPAKALVQEEVTRKGTGAGGGHPQRHWCRRRSPAKALVQEEVTRKGTGAGGGHLQCRRTSPAKAPKAVAAAHLQRHRCRRSPAKASKAVAAAHLALL